MGTAFAIDEVIDVGHVGNAMKELIVKLHLSSAYPNSDGAIANDGEAIGTALAGYGLEYLWGGECISTGVIAGKLTKWTITSGGGTWVASRGWPLATCKLSAAYGDNDAVADGVFAAPANATDFAAAGAHLVFRIFGT